VTVIVLLGAPGAGKGTQAPILAERLHLPHVATGDLFRAAVRDGSPVGIEARRYMERGQLVPDSITVTMLLERLAAPDAAGGVILDGFPRNRAQAIALDAALAERGTRIDRAISIDVPSEELLERMSGRWVCRDASELIQREDDKAETVRARLALTLASLAEVSDHYAAQGLLHRVDGRQSIEQVTADLMAALDDAAAPAASA
jgi:adenylate kinase